jgi:CSLREA domain-containing protein
MKHRSRCLPWAGLGLLLLLMASSSVVSAFPPHIGQWLSRDGLIDDTETSQYYAAIGAPGNFSAWKSAHGFPNADEVTAYYYNAGDLGFGREMHCRRQASVYIACYVANHGFGPGGPAAASVADAINHSRNLGAVAMVYTFGAGTNPVRFYIYAADGSRLDGVQLDSEGVKNAPSMCLPCHGGSYDAPTNQATGANFLPFDLESFKYSAQAPYRLADQQQAFRKLNALVLSTNPTPHIQEMINKWYEDTGGVNHAGAVFNGAKVAAAYDGNVADRSLYNQVVKPYCRTCHIAQTSNLSDPAQFSTLFFSIWGDVYSNYSMPHAERTNHNFWTSTAPIVLANNRGWSLRVTKTADTDDGFCDSDCSLREALSFANAHGGNFVITFNVYGTFTLSLGELLVTNKILILGNGAGQTILDGGSANHRVIHLQGASANLVLQGVTIQHGFTTTNGGGILNEGGQLYLNASVVRNNISTKSDFWAGAGIANVDSYAVPSLEVNNSTIGPGNDVTGGSDGGGILNLGGLLTVTNSTISGNLAGQGGGIFTQGANSRARIDHVTITLNHSTLTGGGLVTYDDLVLRNSIVAGNTSDGVGYRNCAVAVGANASLQGRNILGYTGNCPNTANDIIWFDSVSKILNTGLAAQNGGVAYHALVPGSPALDALTAGVNASCALPSYDQRNLARPLNGTGARVAACDIGAHEFQPITLSSTADVVADDGVCTLREAVLAANTGHVQSTNLGECPPSPDWIELARGVSYNLTSGPLLVSSGLTINGNGATIRRTGGTGRLFQVTNGAILSLQGVTIRDGNQTGVGESASGGGLLVDPGGTANILNSAILNNTTTSWGGGVANRGVLNMANSTVSGNQASLNGGGINNQGTAYLVNVTITDNTADSDKDGSGNGGGLSAVGGAVTVKGSLLAGNHDLDNNSDPDAYKFLFILPSPDGAENQSGSAAAPGIGPEQPSSNRVNPDAQPASGFLISGNYNLVGDGTGSGGSFSGSHDQVGTSANPIDPRLGPLTGLPAYYLLGAVSPAIDRIPASDCSFISSDVGNPLFNMNAIMTTDQRGVARPLNGNGTLACDVGAIEYEPQVFMPLVSK